MPFTGTTSPLLKGTPIYYNVLYQDGEIKQAANPTSATVTVICETAFATSERFLQHMLGRATRKPTYIERMLPEVSLWGPFTLNPVHYALSADAVKFIGWTGKVDPLDKAWPAYDRVQYAVTYGAPLYELSEDNVGGVTTDESTRFVLWSKNGAASNERIPGNSFKFINANKDPIGETGIRTGRTVSLEAKWLDVPYVNYTRIAAISNRINAAAVTFDGQTYPAETVLFESWSEAKKRDVFGQRVSDVTFKFLVRQDLDSTGAQRTWNKFWTKDGLTVEVSSDGTTGGVRVFQTADLKDLFKV